MRDCKHCENYKKEPGADFYSCSVWNCTQDAIKAPNRGEIKTNDKIFIHEVMNAK